MAEQTNPAPAKGNGAGRSFGVNLAGDGGRTLRFLATRRKDGTWKSRASLIVRTGGKIVSRDPGASATHANREEAEKAINAAVDIAIKKQGWQKRRGGGGFAQKPDTFSLKNLPTASGK